MQKAQENKTTYLKAFAKVRKKIIKLTAVSFTMTFLSIAIVGTQLFYPFHIVIGIGIYLLSFIPFIRRVYLSRETWQKYKIYTGTKRFFKREKKVILMSILFFIVALAFLTLRPFGDSELSALSDNEIHQRVVDDLYQSITAMDYLESTGDELIQSLQTDEENANVAEDIEKNFVSFLQAVTFSESLTDVHRHFADIPYRFWNDRVVSFTIAYSLYVKKYELLHRMMRETSGSEYKKKILNQYIPLYERANVYNEMISRFYAPKTRLRISAGWVYHALFNTIDWSAYGNAYVVLSVKADEGYRYLIQHFDETILNTGEVVVDSTRNRMFDVWLPIQRGVANAMGRTVISTRGHEYFVTVEQIRAMELVMEPGDVMLQRRNWHLSNVGIPGFWTHSALYTGDLATMDEYFASEFPYEGYDNMSSYLKVQFPAVYDTLRTPDTDGNARSVIEGIEPGIVLQSLEISAHADFVVTLRPNLTKRDKMLALFKSFSHFGKPYDYNFDFDTRDALVCSELIVDSYFPRLPGKNGLHFETSVVNGRKIVSPLDFAQTYKEEFGSPDAQFSFVYFIRGDEVSQQASVATHEEFIESVEWNKFSFLQSTQSQ